MIRRSVYYRDSIVVVDHEGFIIYVHVGSQAATMIIAASRTWISVKPYGNILHVEKPDRPEEYLLGDLVYLGLDMFILRRADFREVAKEQQTPIIEAFNRRHGRKQVKVEWGIQRIR
jgi:hypothetical protein